MLDNDLTSEKKWNSGTHDKDKQLIRFSWRRLLRWSIHSVIFTALSIAWLFSAFSYADVFNCAGNHCGLYAKESFPNYVVGTVSAVASEEQSIEVFEWAKENGYWANLPESPDRFTELVQILSITVPDDDSNIEMSLLLSREEYDASPLMPGDLVRYTRHRSDEPMTPLFKAADTKVYWDLFGCIAILCREDDKPCPSQYVQGVFRFEDGVQLDSETGELLRAGVKVDTETYFPIADQ